jgi:hypothetical protein
VVNYLSSDKVKTSFCIVTLLLNSVLVVTSTAIFLTVGISVAVAGFLIIDRIDRKVPGKYLPLQNASLLFSTITFAPMISAAFGSFFGLLGRIDPFFNDWSVRALENGAMAIWGIPLAILMLLASSIFKM